jgi:G3E family GTPase
MPGKRKRDTPSASKRIPVTVLTGFLGSGKTTFLNYLLHEKHGRKIAIIENEFGEVSIDDGLVIQTDEEIIEMMNGCICCTVRDDLIKTLQKLAVEKAGKFDSVIIETTGKTTQPQSLSRRDSISAAL